MRTAHCRLIAAGSISDDDGVGDGDGGDGACVLLLAVAVLVLGASPSVAGIDSVVDVRGGPGGACCCTDNCGAEELSKIPVPWL